MRVKNFVRVSTISSVNLVWNRGVVDRVKNFDISRQISKKCQFFQAISQEKIRFSRNIFEKISIFFRQFKKYSIFQAKIGHLQLLLGKLFYFSSKVITFEHTSSTWWDIIIFHDPSTTPSAQNLGSQPPCTLLFTMPHPQTNQISFYHDLS